MYRQRKQCYRNAFLNAEIDPKRFVYCEGFCWHRIGQQIPIRHAWIIARDKPQLALDSTLDKATIYDYLGVPIQQSSIAEFMRENQTFGPVLGWPAFSGSSARQVIEPIADLKTPE